MYAVPVLKCVEKLPFPITLGSPASVAVTTAPPPPLDDVGLSCRQLGIRLGNDNSIRIQTRSGFSVCLPESTLLCTNADM